MMAQRILPPLVVSGGAEKRSIKTLLYNTFCSLSSATYIPVKVEYPKHMMLGKSYYANVSVERGGNEATDKCKHVTCGLKSVGRYALV